MSNSFYNHGAFPSTGSAATSASMRAELDLVSAGFDKMPTLAGNANKFVIINSTGTGMTQTDVLPAFSVNDTDFTVQDNADNTRKFQFDAGPITTGNTRIYSMPDLDTTLVGTNATQTLTNKTLTAPVIATIVNTGTLTLPTSTDTLVGRATTDTLTNKTLTNPVIGTIINTGTLTLPTLTDTLVGRATTDTLSNKSISGASNTLANIGNSSLTNSSVVIGSTTLSLGGTLTTLAGVTISGASNTLTNIANASLTNSGVTINGTTVALGGSATITAVNPNALTIGTGLSGTSYTGSAAVTIAIDATVATLSGAQTLSNKTISGSSNTLSNIANASLSNSTITIGSSAISLGSTATTISGLTSLSSTGLVMTASAASSTAISAIAQSAGTVTVTAAGHGLSSSDLVSIDGVADYTYTGLVTVNVTNANVFTYSRTTTNASSSGGYVTKLQGTWASYSGGTGPTYKGGPVAIDASSQMPALRVTQSGNGYAFIVEDAANPDTSAFIISNAGDLAINTNKFTVAAATGNTVIGGTTSFGGNIVSNILFTDATYDIGATGANRPRDLFLSRNLVVGGTLTLAGGVNLNGNVTIGDASSDTLAINSTITSNLIFTDNTYDIGASGATRPRTLYLGTSLITPAITNSGLTSGRVTYATTGGLLTDSANLTFNGTTLAITGAASLSGDITQSSTSARITYSNATTAGNGGLQNNTGGSYVLLYPSTHATKPNHTDIQGTTAVNILVGGTIGTFSSTGLAVTGTLTSTGDILLNGSGNPSLTVKTSGAGNNPFIRIQADTNYWDLQSIFSNTTDDLDIRYNGTSRLNITSAGAISATNAISTTIGGKTAAFDAVGNSVYSSYNDATRTWRTGVGITIAGRYSIYDVTGANEMVGVNSVGSTLQNFSGHALTPALYINNGYGTTGDTTACIRMNLNSGSGGGYIWGYSGDTTWTHNMEYVAATGSVARATTASQIQQTGGNIIFFTNTGLTAGNTFIPSEAARFDTSQNLLIGSGSGALGKLYVVQSAAQNAMWASSPSGTTQQAILTLQNASNSGYLSIAGVGTASAVPTWTNGSMVIESVPASSGGLILSTYTGALIFQNGRVESGRFETGVFTVKASSIVSSYLISTNANPQTNQIVSFHNNGGSYSDLAIDGSNVVIRTSGAERARVDGNGRVQIGTTTALFSATLTLKSATNSYSLTSSREGAGTGSLGHVVFVTDSGAVGTIFTSGSTTSYNTSSDYRLKNITGPITNSGAYIDSLEPCEGTWIANGSVFVGLIAHKTQEVSRTPVATGVKDGDVMQGMDYSSPEIIANLIAEVQSLRKRLAAANL